MLTLVRYRYRSALAVLLLPSLLLIGIFSYYPAVRSLIGGFYKWNGFSPPAYDGISSGRPSPASRGRSPRRASAAVSFRDLGRGGAGRGTATG